MGRPWAAGLALAALVWSVTLTGCAPQGAAAASSFVGTTVTTMVPATVPTAAATATAHPSPSATATPAATATPQPWTPGPLATPGKAAYDAAAQGALYSDFIILQQNGLQGLVGSDGHEILPCRFASVEAVRYRYTDFFAGDHAFAPFRKPLFFAVFPQPGPIKQDMSRVQGRIYGANGVPINQELVLRAYYIGPGVLRAEVLTGEGDAETITNVVLNDTGRVLARGDYTSVAMVDGRIYASSEGRGKTDVFTAAGKKIRTLPTAMLLWDTVSVGRGKYLAMSDFNGTGGVTLLDRDLHPMFVVGMVQDMLAENRFLVTMEDGSVGVVDGKGNPVVPPKYEDVDLARDGSKDYLCAQGRGGCALYDMDGKVLYQSQEFTRITRTDGRLIVLSGEEDTSIGRALGLDGHDLLGRSDVREWLPDAKLYCCQDGENNTVFLREDGSQLPLPKTLHAKCLSADRFLVTLQEGKDGLCNSAGKYIIPASGNLQEGGLPGVLIYSGMVQGHTAQWLVDWNGNRLWSQPVDDIQYTWQRGLYEVHQGSKHGVMGLDGDWIWSASDYQELQD